MDLVFEFLPFLSEGFQHGIFCRRVSLCGLHVHESPRLRTGNRLNLSQVHCLLPVTQPFLAHATPDRPPALTTPCHLSVLRGQHR